MPNIERQTGDTAHRDTHSDIPPRGTQRDNCPGGTTKEDPQRGSRRLSSPKGTKAQRLMNIMATGQNLQLDLLKVKRQLMEIMAATPPGSRGAADLTQIQVNSPRGQAMSPRVPVLGVSGVNVQRRYNQKLQVRKTPSCRACGSPYPVVRQRESRYGLTPGGRRRHTVRTLTDDMISSAVHSTVTSHAGLQTPDSDVQTTPKRRRIPVKSELRRGARVSKRPKRSDSLSAHEVLGPSTIDNSASLSENDITDQSIDVDTFPLLIPRLCSPVTSPKVTAKPKKDSVAAKSLHEISSISRSSKTNLREQLSGNESALLQHGNALHSTFNYPLHSTMNYPLHSTMAMTGDLTLDITCKVTEGQRSVQSNKGKCSKDSTCSCSECFTEDMEASQRRNKTAFQNEADLAAERLAVRLQQLPVDDTHDSHLRRQVGQPLLGQPRSPVELSESDFLSNTVLQEASVNATKGSLFDDEEAYHIVPERIIRRKLVLADRYAIKTPSQRPQPQGLEMHNTCHTPVTSHPRSHSNRRSWDMPLSVKPPQDNFYDSSKYGPQNPDYENVLKYQRSSSRRRSSQRAKVQEKENSCPPQVPSRCPVVNTPGPHSLRHSTSSQRGHLSEMDSVLSARPGCFNLLKSSVKKKVKGQRVKVTSYDQERKKMLSEKMKHFQRSVSNLRGSDNEEITLLGHL